jgi:phosphoserine phosphatase
MLGTMSSPANEPANEPAREPASTPACAPVEAVVLFDVDNTLLDNDAVQEDLSGFLQRELGASLRERYWAIFEALRSELGYADYLGALQRLRLEAADDPRLPLVSAFLLDYPFASRVYPGALAAIGNMARLGTTVILSDGDMVMQPHKIRRAGLWHAVAGRVLIYIHKEQMLASVERRYPARRFRHLRASRQFVAEQFQRMARAGDHAGDLRVPVAARASTARCSSASTRTRCPSPRCQRAGGAGGQRRRGDALDERRVHAHAGRVARDPDLQPRAHEGLADGIVITPSHNPPDNGGFKYNPPNGGPADTDVTKGSRTRPTRLLAGGLAGVKRIPLAQALLQPRPRTARLPRRYVADLGNVVDMDAIRGRRAWASIRWAAPACTTGAASPSATIST